MIRAACAAILLALSGTGGALAVEARYDIVDFDDLDGWEADEPARALSVFARTCGDMRDVDWRAVCAFAQEQPDARDFFELFFRPVLITQGDPALFTGYFEPELDGALQPDDRFRYPLYREPPEARDTDPWLTRREIQTGPEMKDRGLEIAWVDDSVDLFFLQIQGSGRIRLRDGSTIRVGYGGANGHEYRSIGTELIRRGVYDRHQVSAQVIRSWVRRHPEEGEELLMHNPSYVFFRRIEGLDPSHGPRGAMNRAITKGRSIAVDPAFVPLGAPVWIEKAGSTPMHRLMVAQDTGAAIKGAQRADIFMGTGAAAGRAAGKIRDGGRMLVLMPIQRAYALAPGAT